MDELSKVIGDNIKKFRQARGLTQDGLRQLIDCGQNHVYRWEHGDFVPSAPYLLKIATALECSIDALFGRDHFRGCKTMFNEENS